MKACVFVKPETTHLIPSLIKVISSDVTNKSTLADQCRLSMIDGFATLMNPSHEPIPAVKYVRTGLVDEDLFSVMYGTLDSRYYDMVHQAVMGKPYGLIILDLPTNSTEEMTSVLTDIKGKFQTSYSLEGTGIRGGMRREYAGLDPSLKPGEEPTLTPPFRSSFVHIPDTESEVNDIYTFLSQSESQEGIVYLDRLDGLTTSKEGSKLADGEIENFH